MQLEMKADAVPDHVLNVISTLERVCSSISLMGCLFIIITFLSHRAFHKPINRLVFCASFGNIMSNGATLVARASLSNTHSALCKTQGFMIQMFMPADAYWTLAMALNVFFTFFYRWDAEQLRRFEFLYIGLCYGIPFIPAFIFCFVSTASKGNMYGNALLWCWVSSSWDGIRIYTFYAPVWLAIATTIMIYTATGWKIWKKRRELRMFQSSTNPTTLNADRDGELPLKSPGVFKGTKQYPVVENPFAGDYTYQKTFEIKVTREVHGESTARDSVSGSGSGSDRNTKVDDFTAQAEEDAGYHVGKDGQKDGKYTTDIYAPPLEKSWLDGVPYGHEVGGAISNVLVGMRVKKEKPKRKDKVDYAEGGRTIAEKQANRASMAYFKVALLFFMAMMVTWIPSTANRVYSFIHPSDVNIPLEYMSACVLPLQGFWNAVIYAATSAHACKMLWHNMWEPCMGRRRSRMSNFMGGNDIALSNNVTHASQRLPSRADDSRRKRTIRGSSGDSDSMTELTNIEKDGVSRTVTRDGTYTPGLGSIDGTMDGASPPTSSLAGVGSAV